jgi:hypothetical protein
VKGGSIVSKPPFWKGVACPKAVNPKAIKDARKKIKNFFISPSFF